VKCGNFLRKGTWQGNRCAAHRRTRPFNQRRSDGQNLLAVGFKTWEEGTDINPIFASPSRLYILFIYFSLLYFFLLLLLNPTNNFSTRARTRTGEKKKKRDTERERSYSINGVLLISLSLRSRHGRAIKKEGSEGFFFLIDIEEA